MFLRPFLNWFRDKGQISRVVRTVDSASSIPGGILICIRSTVQICMLSQYLLRPNGHNNKIENLVKFHRLMDWSGDGDLWDERLSFTYFWLIFGSR